MPLGLDEIIRSEQEEGEEGGLSAPVNVISEDSLDCGCKQLQCPKLVKYATWPVYVTILCFIGALQGACHAYLLITSLTVSRRFGIDHYTMDWVLGIFHLARCLGGLTVSYWGNKIHRASWTGTLVLLQSTCFLTFLIPQFTHPNRSIEEPVNTTMTHLSIYAEESPEVCIREGSARILFEENDPCYFILFIFGTAQLLSGLANVAYYALGISYLDDNTARKNVASYLGLILSMEILGVLFGSLLAWSFLKIDADNFNPVESYREQIGAWWLGWPILAVLLAIPALLLAIFPRRLVTEVIEQAAGKILNGSGRSYKNYNVSVDEIGSTLFLPSMLRLLKNKILIFNALSAAFCIMALYNFLLNENVFLESRFYIPRPNGLLLGFNDPIVSRAISNTLKPLVTGLAIIISGLVITKTRPKAISLAGYNSAAIFLTAIIIAALTFDNCNKRPIVGDKYNKLALIKYCNYDCRCMKDADFRPVCDTNIMFTFYSACYAGCSTINVTNGIKSYDGCTCVQDMTGKDNFKATEGFCESDNCQFGWILFEIFTILAYSLSASCIVGEFLINLRSCFMQDKACMIALWVTCISFFVQIPGKLIHKAFADSTCKHFGLDNQTCRFHSENYGNYLCLLTAFFLLLGGAFKAIVCFFCKNLELYEVSDQGKQQEQKLEKETEIQTEPLIHPEGEVVKCDTNPTNIQQEQIASQEPVSEELSIVKVTPLKNVPVKKVHSESEESKMTCSKTESRPNSLYASLSRNKTTKVDLDTSSDESNIFNNNSESRIIYKPLEMDSDTENDLFNYGPRSRKRIPSKTDENEPSEKYRPFPSPDNYEDPRHARGYKKLTNDGETSTEIDKTQSICLNANESQGDFNEVGLPKVDNYECDFKRSKIYFDKSQNSIVMYQYDNMIGGNGLHDSKLLVRSLDEMRVPLDMEKAFHVLTDKLVRPPSRDQESSGFGSLQNIPESSARQPLRRNSSKESLNSKNSASTSESQSKSSAITTDL